MSGKNKGKCEQVIDVDTAFPALNAPKAEHRDRPPGLGQPGGELHVRKALLLAKALQVRGQHFAAWGWGVSASFLPWGEHRIRMMRAQGALDARAALDAHFGQAS